MWSRWKFVRPTVVWRGVFLPVVVWTLLLMDAMVTMIKGVMVMVITRGASEMDCKLKSKIMDKLYMLDYNDIIFQAAG